MPRFSMNTEALLIKAGWQEGRKIDTTKYEQILRKEGFEVPNCVIALLQEFGGLRVVHPHAKVPKETNDFIFDVDKAVVEYGYSWAKRNYNHRVGKKLCSVGEACNAHMILVMSSDGEVFGGFDDFLCYIGSSGDDAIEALCSGRDVREIPQLGQAGGWLLD
jgi:hypothetical protein